MVTKEWCCHDVFHELRLITVEFNHCYGCRVDRKINYLYLKLSIHVELIF